MDKEEMMEVEKIGSESYTQGYWDRREEEVRRHGLSGTTYFVAGCIVGACVTLWGMLS